MKRTVIPLALPAMQGNETAEFGFEISDPGDIIECILQVKEKAGGIVSAQNPNAPAIEILPTILVNIDPDAPTRKRSFIVTPPMKVVEADGEIIYRGRFLFPNGALLVVYEEVEKPTNLLLP